MSVNLPVVNQPFVETQSGRISRPWYLALLNLNNQVTPGVVTSVNISGNNGITAIGGPITSSGVFTLGIGHLTCTDAIIAGTVTAADMVASASIRAANMRATATLTSTNVVAIATVTAADMVATGTIKPASTGGIIGTATNDNANAGSFGEFTNATLTQGPAVSLSTGTTANVTNILLTAGDWDIDGTVSFLFQGGTNFTNLIGGSSISSATLNGDGTYFDFETPAIGPGVSFHHTWVIPHRRLSLASTLSCNLVAQATFSGGTLQAFGEIMARRMR